MELYATPVVWHGGGKLTVYDKTQGVQNVQALVTTVSPGNVHTSVQPLTAVPPVSTMVIDAVRPPLHSFRT